MSVFRLHELTGRSPDDAFEIFDYQTPNAAHDIVFAKLRGEHNGGTNRRSTFTYAVTAGNATFVIDGAAQDVVAGDVVTANPGSSKVIRGEAELLIICSPPFDPADEHAGVS